MNAGKMIELLRAFPPETEILVIDETGGFRPFEKFLGEPQAGIRVQPNAEPLERLAVVMSDGPLLRKRTWGI